MLGGCIGMLTWEAPREEGRDGKKRGLPWVPWHVNTEGSVSVTIKLRAEGQAGV